MNKIIYWLPRVLGILFVLFLAMFSLDVFEEGRSAGEIAVGLFMHNIPALILAAVVAISWKHEIVGGVGFILAGLLYMAMILCSGMREGFEWYMLSWPMTIAVPAFLIGGLFLAGWRGNKSGK